MKSAPDPVKTVMAREMRRAGFKGRNNTWHKFYPEVILVVNLQKSIYGPQYYVNLAAWVRQLGEVAAPKEHQCHFSLRIERLQPERAKELERALNPGDASMSPEERETYVSALLSDHALPFLESLATLEGIREAISSGRIARGAVSRALKELLGIQ